MRCLELFLSELSSGELAPLWDGLAPCPGQQLLCTFSPSILVLTPSHPLHPPLWFCLCHNRMNISDSSHCTSLSAPWSNWSCGSWCTHPCANHVIPLQSRLIWKYHVVTCEEGPGQVFRKRWHHCCTTMLSAVTPCKHAQLLVFRCLILVFF